MSTVPADSATAPFQMQRSAVVGRSQFLPRATLSLLFLATAMNPIQAIIPEAEVTRGADNFGAVTAIKLAIAAASTIIGFWGWMQGAAVRSLFATMAGFLLAILSATFLVTSLFAFADSATISRAASLIFLGYILFIAVAVTIVDLKQILAAMALGSVTFMLVTWAVYITMPSIGHFVEYTDSVNSVMRMGGTAHPNGIAREAMMAMIVCVCFLYRGDWIETRPMVRVVLWSVLLLGLATLMQTMSRTAIVAGSAAMVALMWDRLWTRAGILAVISGSATVIGVLLIGLISSRDQSGADRIASLLTKSGSVDEITSLTGRTDIWAESIALIRQRPWTGWGLDSAASLMSEHAMGTHNLVLHVMFSGGIVAALVLILLLVATAMIAWSSPQPIFRAIAAYIFVSAMLEDTLVESFPSSLTLLWLVLLLYPAAEAIRGRVSGTTQSSIR